MMGQHLEQIILSSNSHRRWYHAEVTVTADSIRLSVNNQPSTEQSVGVDVVAMLERLTIGGGTASGERRHNMSLTLNKAW